MQETGGADIGTSTLALDPHCFCSEFWPPLGCPVALVVQLRGQAKARTTRPPESPAHARHTGGEEPASLAHRPPREDLPHPGHPPHSRGGFRPGKRSGRKAQAGHRPGGKARLAFPPSRRRRRGKTGALRSRTSAPPQIFNLPPGLRLPQLGSRFPAPVSTRVCRRRRSRREPEAASGLPSPRATSTRRRASS